MKQSSIYAIVDEFGIPHYVGQTTMGIETRFLRHLGTARNPTRPLGFWLRANPTASVVPLEMRPVDPDEAERRWIRQLREFGHPLLNVYDGGKSATTGYRHMPASRARISAARAGKPLSAEHRRKLSEAHSGVPLGSEHREAIGRGGKGLVRSDESRARLSASKRGDLNPMSARRRAERAAEGGEAL